MPAPPADRNRVATFNTSLYSDEAGGLVARLRGDDAPARRIAATIQHVRPDVLLLNEFDYDEAGEAAGLFVGRYLGEGQHGQIGRLGHGVHPPAGVRRSRHARVQRAGGTAVASWAHVRRNEEAPR